MNELRRTRPEDYLSAVDSLCENAESTRASTGDIASRIGVSKGTVSSVLKELADGGLIDLIPYEGATLTEAGRQRARQTIRRCLLLEAFLCHTLGDGWKSIGDEAWRLEPSASDELIDRIDVLLNHPEYDFRGEPIPHIDGSLPRKILIPLTAATVGESVTVARILDQSMKTLEHLDEIRLTIGTEIVVKEISVGGGVVVVDAGRGNIAIGVGVAVRILVRRHLQRGS